MCQLVGLPINWGRDLLLQDSSSLACLHPGIDFATTGNPVIKTPVERRVVIVQLDAPETAGSVPTPCDEHLSICKHGGRVPGTGDVERRARRPGFGGWVVYFGNVAKSGAWLVITT